MIKLVIFDFDGTLFDTKAFIKKYLKKRLKPFGIPTETEKQFQNIYLVNFYETMKKYGATGKDIARFKKMSILLRSRQAPHVKAFPFISNALKQLKKTAKIAVISSSFTKPIKISMKANKILKYFDFILGAEKEENKVKKINAAMKRCKAKPSETVYVGDTVGDVIEAKKAKVRAVAAAWGFHPKKLLKKAKPYMILTNPKQLIRVLK